MTAPDTYLDLLFAYSVIWLIIAVFLVRIGIEQARLRREIEALKKVSEPPKKGMGEVLQMPRTASR